MKRAAHVVFEVVEDATYLRAMCGATVRFDGFGAAWSLEPPCRCERCADRYYHWYAEMGALLAPRAERPRPKP